MRFAGVNEIPAVVVLPKSEQEAELIAIETNMCQRSMEEIPISIKARAVAGWYNCIKAQGLRTDLLNEIAQLERLESMEFSMPPEAKNIEEKNVANPDEIRVKSTSRQIGELSTSAEYISEKTGLSIREIQRLIRLATLSDELLKKVDDGIIPYTAAYELTFVPKDTRDFRYLLLKFIL